MDIKKKRIVFMGTPQFAVPSLSSLIADGFNVVGVCTQVDKPSYNLRIKFSPVKELALKHNLPILQFPKIRSDEGVQAIKDLQPDLIITAAFGQLLTQQILDIPTIGVYNVHASLLPKYRGGCPIHWCIIDGNTDTGISIMRTEKGLDTGPVILQIPCKIDKDQTYDDVYTHLSFIGASALQEFLFNFEKLIEQPQDDSQSSYQPIIKKQDGKIEWSKDSLAIHNHIRGVTSTPGAFCILDELILKVYKTSVVESDLNGKIGQVVCADNKFGIIVACGKGHIQLLELQLPSKKILSARDFLNGNKLLGKVLE
ncbi:MAG: methionyl-tRNA formyltransferase [Firmicutes bacterium]|nr:methionyl-tRNA formyltransferase [Bacillota bacterium]MCL1953812.1 methionyl-tRNA formyltransferase [Bacillota bacterium]